MTDDIPLFPHISRIQHFFPGRDGFMDSGFSMRQRAVRREYFLHDVIDIHNFEWLVQARGEPVFMEIRHDGVVGIAARHNGSDGRIEFPENDDGFLSAHFSGNGQIHEDRIERMTGIFSVLVLFDGFRAVGSVFTDAVHDSEHFPEELTDVLLIVDNQDMSAGNVSERSLPGRGFLEEEGGSGGSALFSPGT